MRARRAGALCAALAATAVAFAAMPCQAEPGSARRIEVDPRTGRVVQPSDRDAPAAAADQSTSHEGLVERAGSSAAGGVGVRLQGRFRSTVRVTRGSDGQLVRDCVP